MKKGLTEMVFILDRSGSMAGLEADTIGGYNSMLEKQKTLEGEALVSTVLFDHESTVICDRRHLTEVPEMTEEEYYVRGCTALLDAVGGAIHHIGNVHKYARDEDRPEKTVFVITTDGVENASKIYTYSKVQSMIKRQTEKYGWEFLFLGANIDAKAEAKRFGIDENRAVKYHSDKKGTALNYKVVGQALSELRCRSAISDDWAEEIEEMYDKH
ncbi:MAG: hypothetical protein MR908_01830 [Firmicutes bacterium]|nr:hypothetical protein [Bacillota bacterium]